MAAGLVLVVGAVALWTVERPDPAGQTVSPLGASAAEGLTSPSPASSGMPETVTLTPSATTVESAATFPPLSAADDGRSPMVTTPTPPGSVTSTTSLSIPDPARLVIDALGVDAEIVPVGVDSTGAMAIPVDVGTIGWYRFGPSPGDVAGSVVMTGHVDSREQGPGAFARLGDLTVDDVIVVSDVTGVDRQYTVIAREEWPKGQVPMDRLFDRGGSPRLVLITCGGSFDAGVGHYEDNIAITAIPLG